METVVSGDAGGCCLAACRRPRAACSLASSCAISSSMASEAAAGSSCDAMRKTCVCWRRRRSRAPAHHFAEIAHRAANLWPGAGEGRTPPAETGWKELLPNHHGCKHSICVLLQQVTLRKVSDSVFYTCRRKELDFMLWRFYCIVSTRPVCCIQHARIHCITHHLMAPNAL